MTPSEKTIFNFRLRKNATLRDVDSHNVSDDDYVLHHSARSGEKEEKETPMQLLKEKTAFIHKQAVLQKALDPT